jgi:hypothetical protein
LLSADFFTIILAVLTPIFAATTLYLAIKRYRESSKRKRYTGEGLLSIQSVTKKLEQARDRLNHLVQMDSDVDASSDIDFLVSEILRAHFDLKSDKLTVHFRISSIDGEGNEELQYGPNANRVGEMLRKKEIRGFSTDAEIEGITDRSVSSPSLSELVWTHRELLEVTTEIDHFKEMYEALDPNIVKNLQEIADSLCDITEKCAQNKDIELDLGTFRTSNDLTEHISNELLGIQELKNSVSQLDNLITAIRNVRKELFTISFMQS